MEIVSMIRLHVTGDTILGEKVKGQKVT